ncbi:MAG: hypothetical protein ABL986_08770 [Vicinamibacterales bacterium]
MNGLQTSDELILSLKKRMVVQRTTSEAGGPALNLYYGDKEISFDEPELFAFGETLATQSHFTAGAAVEWSGGQNWATLKPLLEHLIAEGILKHASDATVADDVPDSMVCPSPLPESSCTRPRTWNECEAITGELTGRPVEVGYLELVIPVFRVAHIALDADGRQVGEANVFPRSLRLDAPTTWLTCAYPGTRHMSDRPMNVTALKAMRLHWKQMMATLSRIRAGFLQRFPDAAEGWTVGRVERLATMVLAVPTYQLVKADGLANGQLHPALSSLFRVTDGLRMTMHQMLFVPIGEPTMPADAPLTSDQIFEYAERNYSFHSETGVCAGPQHMIQQFIRVLLDGEGAEQADQFAFDAPVAAALAEMDAAFDYGLYGLQVYGAFFSLWPAMTRAYEQLGDIAEAGAAAGVDGLAPFRDRLRERVDGMRRGTYLATEEWRVHREQVYADMYEQCGRGLSVPDAMPPLAAQLAVAPGPRLAEMEGALTGVLADRFAAAENHTAIVEMARHLVHFFATTQAIIRAACVPQTRINQMLGRPAPTRPFGADEADVHNLLQGAELRRLPYLVDELADVLDLEITIDACRIDVKDRRIATACV